MILNRVVFSLAFIMQHTFTNAREPILGEEGEKIEGSHHNHQDSNHSMDTITSYLRGDSKYSTMSAIRSEMSDRNLGVEEKCNIPSGTFFIQSVSLGKYMKISGDSGEVKLTKPNMGSFYDNSYIRSLGNDEYAIHSPWIERYASVPKSGNHRTIGTQTYAGSKERFYITCFDNGEVAFKSKKYGNYLSADEKGKVDTYTTIGNNEKWLLITEGVHAGPKPDKTYYIQSAHGYYISMDNKNKVKLMKDNKSYEKITLRSMCDYPDPNPDNWYDCDTYALKSATHGERYLSDGGKGGTVGAKTYVRSYEMFYMQPLSDGKVAFWSRQHYSYLHAGLENRSKLNTVWKGFSVEDVFTEFTLIPV